MIREGTRQGLRLVSRRVQLDVDLFRCREQDRHYPMDRRDDAVRLGRKEGVQFVLCRVLACHPLAVPGRTHAGKEEERLFVTKSKPSAGVLCP